jgi:hypothetical protein
MPLILGFGVTSSKQKKKRENDIYNDMEEPCMAQIKNFLRKCPLTGPPKNSPPSKFCNM